MLVPRPENKIIVRYLRNDAGELFVAYFVVVERGGHFYARLIRVEPVAQEKREEVAALPSPIVRFHFETCKNIFPEPSPYFTRDFSFVSSQMTRAPSEMRS